MTADPLLEHGRMRRGYLGVAGQAVQLADEKRALLIVDVKSGSPADGGGLRVGDSIVSFDGHSVEEPEDLLDLLGEDRIGKQVAVSLVRGDNVKEVQVTIGDRTVS